LILELLVGLRQAQRGTSAIFYVLLEQQESSTVPSWSLLCKDDCMVVNVSVVCVSDKELMPFGCVVRVGRENLEV